MSQDIKDVTLVMIVHDITVSMNTALWDSGIPYFSEQKITFFKLLIYLAETKISLGKWEFYYLLSIKIKIIESDSLRYLEILCSLSAILKQKVCNTSTMSMLCLLYLHPLNMTLFHSCCWNYDVSFHYCEDT